jgi:hypothetical protein
MAMKTIVISLPMNENHGGEVMLIVRYKNGPILNMGGLNITLVFRAVGRGGGRGGIYK